LRGVVQVSLKVEEEEEEEEEMVKEDHTKWLNGLLVNHPTWEYRDMQSLIQLLVITCLFLIGSDALLFGDDSTCTLSVLQKF
jgi:hypothetical protein